MTPPRALISSTASVAPQRTPSPVMAAGPLIAEAKPMRISGAWAPAETAMRSMVASVRASRLAFSSLSNDREILAGAGERAGAAGGDLDGVLDLYAAPAVLVIGCLDAEHHARLERGGGRRVDGGRVVGLEPDSVGDVVSLVMRARMLARDAAGEL